MNILGKCTIVLSILLVSVGSASAQAPDVDWMKTYGGTGGEEIYAIDVTGDGYIIAGHTSSYGGGNADLYVLKTDLNGDSLWMAVWGTSRQERGRDVIACSGGGYAVVGIERIVQANMPQVFFHRLDAAGAIVNTKNYGHIGDDDAWSIVETSDGGFLIGGTTDVSNSGNNNVYLIRTDASGDTLWTRNYGGLEDDEGYRAEQTPDGGFIVVGHTDAAGASDVDLYLIRTDANGDTLWTRRHGGPNVEFGYCVRPTSDGGFIVAGSTESYGAGQSDFYLVKTNALGDSLWTRTYGGHHYEYARSVITNNNGYTIVGHSQSFGNADKDMYIVRTTLLGDVLWAKVIGEEREDWGYDIETTSDGCYVVAGYTNSYGESDNKAWLVKLEADPTAVDDKVLSPRVSIRCHPNPFNPATTITYRLPEDCLVTVSVYDTAGRKLAVVYDGAQVKGEQTLHWNAMGFPSGVYFVRLDASGETHTVKTILLK
jgi:hypothetical protein